LRERGNDILLLAEFFLRKYMIKYNKPGLKIHQNAQNILLKYRWPGNVRELQHSIEKAVILAEQPTLDENSFTLNDTSSNRKFDLQDKTIEEMEKEMILASIDKEKGNMSAAAKKLGITRPTLYKKLKKFED
jgi:DNA-binding NtrC family response regulator